MLVCIILTGITSYVWYVKQPLHESYFKAKSVRFEAEIRSYKFNPYPVNVENMVIS